MDEPIRESPELEATLPVLIRSVKANGLEGLVAKRRDCRYEPGLRSGAWQKMRVNREQPFVIAGYTMGARNFDAIVFGYYDGSRLMYAGRTRSGFTPASRNQLFKRFAPLTNENAPLPTYRRRRVVGGAKDSPPGRCANVGGLRRSLVGQIEFVEWTPDGHLRHSRFLGLREDKKASEVVREP